MATAEISLRIYSTMVADVQPLRDQLSVSDYPVHIEVHNL